MVCAVVITVHKLFFVLTTLIMMSGPNASAAPEKFNYFLQVILRCSSQLMKTVKADLILPFNSEPMSVPASHSAVDTIAYDAHAQPGRRGDVVYVDRLEAILPRNLDANVLAFLQESKDYLHILQYPAARDRIHVHTLIYNKDLERPSRSLYSTTDFNFEVLEKHVMISMHNPKSVRPNLRMNYAYWVITEHPEAFPYVEDAHSKLYFPVERFPEFIKTVRDLGWEFY